ncbi:MAG: nitronate monooxygenase [Peptoniphilaceae bacterium]
MNLNKILEIKYPFIQGAMAHIARGKFAAQVSNAGAMGVIGTGGMDIETIKKEIEICKEHTNKAFGINLILIHKDIDKIADLVCEYDIKFVTTGAGNPSKYIKKWKNKGIKIFPLVSTKALALRLESLGVDGIIAEGSEAGGHIGELTTMVLLKEVSDAVEIPVIGAGGIGSGSQILAAEALGASGVQMGTILLGSEECPIHENYKNKIISAKSNQVTVMGRINGLATRVLKNEMSKKYIELEKSGAELEGLEMLTLGALRKSVKYGDIKEGTIMCGQVVGSVKEIKSLETIFKELYCEYEKEKEKLCQR